MFVSNSSFCIEKKQISYKFFNIVQFAILYSFHLIFGICFFCIQIPFIAILISLFVIFNFKYFTFMSTFWCWRLSFHIALKNWVYVWVWVYYWVKLSNWNPNSIHKCKKKLEFLVKLLCFRFDLKLEVHFLELQQ